MEGRASEWPAGRSEGAPVGHSVSGPRRACFSWAASLEKAQRAGLAVGHVAEGRDAQFHVLLQDEPAGVRQFVAASGHEKRPGGTTCWTTTSRTTETGAATALDMVCTPECLDKSEAWMSSGTSLLCGLAEPAAWSLKSFSSSSEVWHLEEGPQRRRPVHRAARVSCHLFFVDKAARCRFTGSPLRIDKNAGWQAQPPARANPSLHGRIQKHLG